MFQLAGEIPTPIFAEMLGLSTQTATRWAALVARDWSQHTAARHQDAAERGRTTYVLNEMDPKTCLPRYRR